MQSTPGSPSFPSNTSSPNPIPPPRSTTINDLREQQVNLIREFGAFSSYSRRSLRPAVSSSSATMGPSEASVARSNFLCASPPKFDTDFKDVAATGRHTCICNMWSVHLPTICRREIINRTTNLHLCFHLISANLLTAVP